MTLLGLFDAADEGNTILRNLDIIYKSTLYSVPKDLNFTPDIELCIHEILRLQQFRLWFLMHVRKIAKGDCWLRHVCLYVRPSVRMEQLGSHWTDFHEIWY